MLGLTMVAMVMVEMGCEIFPLKGIWWRSQWGDWYGAPGSGSMVI